MKRLWSPWRMAYVSAEKQSGCVFCHLQQEGTSDQDALILYRGKHAMIVMNKYPYINGHVMVVPYLHTDTPTALDDDALLEMIKLVNDSITVLREALHADGFNIGMNLGASAGAGIEHHIHMHIVPRWTGDTNFMSVLSDTRVICEALDETYRRLKPRFDAIASEQNAQKED
ncbi:MAG: HIT domain-containing protein [Anaerolineae bacterium]|nr:HIT domain-containing protein [Anaerolineae bacterium]